MEDEWDLHAVVRNLSAAAGIDTVAINTAVVDSSVSVRNDAPLGDFVAPFLMPEINLDNNPFDELGNLYKPFYSQKPPPSMAPTPSATAAEVGGILNRSVLQLQQQPLLFPRLHHQQQQQTRRTAHQHRYSKRKNEMKRTTCQVSAEKVLSTDYWAWRKYGQKPIKGSPYPRNYYRCSSSKGCMAKKQVERNQTDPNFFMVTYTGDHCHPRPIVRNSHAGSARARFYADNKRDILKKGSLWLKIATSSPQISPSAATSLSPTSPLAAAVEYESIKTNADDGGGSSAAAKNFENDPADSVNGVSGGAEENEAGNDGLGFLDDILISITTVEEELFLGIDGIGSNPDFGGSEAVPPWDLSGYYATPGRAA
ncbi:hypothetical protein Nepgr_031428 [Nepenthes gracilis]|uniref:WRKY domain-containing protein n=1 Tax=Nepenthes gracilis TaxID=150966 RepID=A0AAD3TGN1_NEPGR|nr:hypothetical protein Nepgr_031428 [Nepenthes gracilis]